jgi:hypothetical protein
MRPIEIVPFAQHQLSKHQVWQRAADSHIHVMKKPSKGDFLLQTNPGFDGLSLMRASACAYELWGAIRGLKFNFVEGNFFLRYDRGHALTIEHSLVSYLDESCAVQEELEHQLKSAMGIIASTSGELVKMPCIKCLEMVRYFTLHRGLSPATATVSHH